MAWLLYFVMGYCSQPLYMYIVVLGLGLDESFDSDMLHQSLRVLLPSVVVVCQSVIVHVLSPYVVVVCVVLISCVADVHDDELTSSLLITTLQFIYARLVLWRLLSTLTMVIQ